MGLSKNRLEEVVEDFKQDYCSKKPYCDYINGCGISNLRLTRDLRKVKLKLKAGESLDDLCLYVPLKEEPPKNLALPSEYKGVRVFYNLVGTIRAL